MNHLPWRFLGWGRIADLLPSTEPEEPAEILFRVAQPGCIEPFIIFCLFPLETDGRELWTPAQVRGSDHACAVSDSRTWTFICPEVKAGLIPIPPSNHKVFTPENFTLKETRGLTSSRPFTMIRGHRGCRPKSRMNYKDRSYPRHPAHDPTQHCQDNFMLGSPDTAESRAANLEGPSTLSLFKWLNTKGKRSECTVNFPRVSRSALGNYL